MAEGQLCWENRNLTTAKLQWLMFTENLELARGSKSYSQLEYTGSVSLVDQD